MRFSLAALLIVAACGDTADALDLDALPLDGGAGDLGARDLGAPELGPRDAGLSAGCAGRGGLDFTLEAAGLERWEGRALWAAALENGRPPDGPRAHRRVVAVEGRVEGGAFSLACPGTLDPRASHPSWAVVVDANGDGVCSAGDRFVSATLFVWGTPGGPIDPASWRVLDPVDPVNIPVGSAATDLCAAFFF